MAEKKKYSLIEVDAAQEETSAVVTTRTVEDGEETIRVSSARSAASEAPRIEAKQDLQRESAPSNEASVDARSFSPSETKVERDEDKQNDEDEVPYKRMQGVIIISLIVLMVVFLIYFNFLR